MPFEALSSAQVYDILRLRQEVFILEQNCPYLDADRKDHLAIHLMAFSNNILAGYSRIFFPGDYYTEYSIGRIITQAEFRGRGLGKEVLRRSLEFIDAQPGSAKIKIAAQSYLLKFYESYGFLAVGDEFLEDNISHFFMLRNPA